MFEVESKDRDERVTPDRRKMQVPLGTMPDRRKKDRRQTASVSGASEKREPGQNVPWVGMGNPREAHDLEDGQWHGPSDINDDGNPNHDQRKWMFI